MYAPYKYHRSAPKAIHRKGQPSDTSNKTYTSRDISDQELISCLHDQPRSCTFSTGDLLFVYTQYNENEQHILWFDIYILYINLCD